VTVAGRTWLKWSAQVALAAVLTWFVAHALAANWNEFRSLDVDLTWRPVPIVLAVITTLGTYSLLIEAWRRVLAGWGDRLDFREAAFIWTVSNLGRYVPGKVWTIAGLAALARRAGAGIGTATASSITMQALAVATGAAVAVPVLTGKAETWMVAAAVALGTTMVAVVAWKPTGVWVLRILGGGGPDSHSLPVGTAVLAASATMASWITHGTAFWLLSCGILSDQSLGPGTAITVFAAGYLLGLLALFAPGGIGVREAVLVTLLTPVVGAGNAVVMSVFSRLYLTVMEVGVAGAMVVSQEWLKERESD
jgi:hypothetical protein